MDSGVHNLSVSVVIRTFDDSVSIEHRKPFVGLREYLVLTLSALAKQTIRPIEIFVVDSSVDNKIEKLLLNYSVQSNIEIIRIPLNQSDFSHSKAINLGVRKAQGVVIVSLSGDATPANSKWLERLLMPFADQKVAGTFSRQIARPDMALCRMEKFRLWWRYRGYTRTVRSMDHIFSNACSAFYRSLALQLPFDETLKELEDYAWAKKVQRKGYTIAYVGDSEVYHSHTLSDLYTLWRMLYYIYLRVKIDAAN